MVLLMYICVGQVSTLSKSETGVHGMHGAVGLTQILWIMACLCYTKLDLAVCIRQTTRLKKLKDILMSSVTVSDVVYPCGWSVHLLSAS